MSKEFWINRTHEKNLKLAKNNKRVRWFCMLVLAIVCSHYFLSGSDGYQAHVLVGSIFLIGFAFPIVIMPVLYIWMWIGSVLGEITSTAVLAFIYFILLLPLNLFVRKTVIPGWKAKDEYSPHENLY